MKPSLQLWFKILAGSIGFVPVLVLFLTRMAILPERGQEKIIAIILLPVVGVLSVANSFHVSARVEIVSFLVTGFIWSSFLAWVCLRYAKMLLGEDELGGHPFDWTAWRLRFVIGFIIGFLFGRRYADNSDGATILVCMVMVGTFVGLAFGAWRENFWSRPL